MSATAAASTADRLTLDRRRVYIFPTRHGFMLGAMVFVILLGSINYDNALGYLLTFLLFGLFLVVMLHTYRNLVGLRYAGANAKPVFAGEPARFIISIDNSRHDARYSIELRHWPYKMRLFRRKTSPPIRVASLSAHQQSQIPLNVATTLRGTVALNRIQLTSTFPLGILRAWAYFNDAVECLVYPRPEGPLALPSYGASSESNSPGSLQGNDDFAGFRAYQAGDPVRAIAWKTLARQDDLLVKRFTGGSAERLWLRFEDTRSLDNTEARLSQLAAWLVEAEQLGLAYGLQLPQLRFPPANGPEHHHRCLRALALY